MSESNVPISEPVFFPQDELISMGGFSWTQEHGLVVGSPREDPLDLDVDWQGVPQFG